MGIMTLRPRWRSGGAMLLLAAAAVAVQVRAQTPDAPSAPSESADVQQMPARGDASAPLGEAPASEDSAASGTRLREGTQLTDRIGYFRQNGDSLTFVDEDGRELGGLPNLSLERIIRMLKSVDEPETVKWSVSGAVTEFSGRNYLLVSRAVYKAAMLPPVPDAVQSSTTGL
jgi:hypothetical protein